MPHSDAAYWSELVRQTLERYDEALLRAVAARLIKPRNQWPVAELLDRCTDAVDNTVLLDRRLQELEPAARQLLALIARSRQPRWVLGNLVELVMALGHADGLQPVFDAALETGIAVSPDAAPVRSNRSSNGWLPPPAPT